jgi:protein-tyrosine phosphatase
LPDNSSSRVIEFEAVFNFRDLGGYLAQNGHRVALSRLFRSGMLCLATPNDLTYLREGIGLKTVLDLRDKPQIEHQGIGPVGNEFAWHNIPLVSGKSLPIDVERLGKLSNAGQAYLIDVEQEGFGRRLVGCLRIMAEPANYPLVFHCSAGKDRTGILAAVLLNLLGVRDEDIIQDYTLTAPHMKAHLERLSRDPDDAKALQSLPAWLHEASAESMDAFLSTMRREYGSIKEYLLSHGADRALFERLEAALLE